MSEPLQIKATRTITGKITAGQTYHVINDKALTLIAVINNLGSIEWLSRTYFE